MRGSGIGFIGVWALSLLALLAFEAHGREPAGGGPKTEGSQKSTEGEKSPASEQPHACSVLTGIQELENL